MNLKEMAFEHHLADVGELQLHYVTIGKGPPVVLLHGWPHTWFAWRDVAPILAEKYRVIMPDLRGLGDTSRPTTGYDKLTMANDIWRLVRDELGYQNIFLAGHDWGGVVAYSLAATHPEAVTRLAILDITIPGDGANTFSQGGRRWHHGFHQVPELPEVLVAGREELYLGWFYRNLAARKDVFPQEVIDEYVRCYSQPGAMHAGFEVYRALTVDAANNAELARRIKLPMPVLAVGGAVGWGRGTETFDSLKRVAENVTGRVFENCGHFIPEEQPELLANCLLEFFGGR
jgi:pimeloyl-ACP methyl ester carboxylesterase